MIAVIIIILVYLYMIMPNLDKDRIASMSSFEKVYLTHRGFFNNKDIPENSIKAFKGTVANGYGTELDVQLTTDNKLVVFHDESLKRMCGVDKKLTDCSYDELLQYNLLDTDEKIPLFEDVLNVLEEDTPLIIEIKPEGDAEKTCELTVQLMKNYKRNFTMESFNPKVVLYLKKNHPEIIRGQLAYDMFPDEESKSSFFIKFICTNYLLNFLTKPDYCAYDVNNMKGLSFQIISRIYKAECVAWTVKSEEMLSEANKYYQQIIFDSFVPKENRI